MQLLDRMLEPIYDEQSFAKVLGKGLAQQDDARELQYEDDLKRHLQVKQNMVMTLQTLKQVIWL